MKKFCVFLLLILVAAAGAGFYGYQRVQQFLAQPVNAQPDQLLTLERGTTGNKLAASEMLGTAQTASAITESAMRWGWVILALVFLLMIFLTRNKKR